MRYVAVAVMFVLALGATLATPSGGPAPGDQPGSQNPPVAICSLLESGDSHTRVMVLSSINGLGRISTFAAGAETGALEFRTGGSGSVTIPAADAGAVGSAGGLIEMPSASTAAGVVITGPSSLAAESCADIPTGQAFLPGGSTASAAAFEVQLLNPYAGEAVVDLTVMTEAGIESEELFDAVIVPALSAITLDLTEIIPGRDSVSVYLETTRGAVLAVGRQTIEGRTAMWRAVEPGLDWWIPVPEGGATKQLRIATPEGVEVEYQIDFYGPDGLVGAFDAGVIGPHGRVSFPIADVTEEAVGIRVISTGPVVPTLWIDSPAGLAATTASPVDAPIWLLPGAQGPPSGSGSIVILNSGLEPVLVNVRTQREDSIVRDFEVDAEGILVVDLVAADGYRVEASGPVVAMWVSQLHGAGTAAMGIPIQDG